MQTPAPDAPRTGPHRVFRFAPSPNGYLHRGHAFSALLNRRAAEVTGGRFLLRMENYDFTRSRPEFEACALEDLAWLGLDWEEPVLAQRDRFDAYEAALGELDRLELLYPAFLTRGEIAAAASPLAARDPDGAPLYPGVERDWSTAKRKEAMDSGAPYALRLDMRRALAGVATLEWTEADPLGRRPDSPRLAEPAEWGDVVLARKEVRASYHLAVVVDDAHQGVTDVVRGRDLEASTSVHRLLQSLLRLAAPRYFHHRLILDRDSQKLSKSRGSETIRMRRAGGETATQLIAGLDLEKP